MGPTASKPFPFPSDLFWWPTVGSLFFQGQQSWESLRVYPGGAPQKLSTGDYLVRHEEEEGPFPGLADAIAVDLAQVFYNGDNGSTQLSVGWFILSKDMTTVVARSVNPLFSPSATSWTAGSPPWLCNIPLVCADGRDGWVTLKLMDRWVTLKLMDHAFSCL